MERDFRAIPKKKGACLTPVINSHAIREFAFDPSFRDGQRRLGASFIR
jgi:hypothetical protein